MTHAVLIYIFLLIGSPAGATPVEGFPCEECDFVVECNDAESLIDALGSGALLGQAFSLLPIGDFAQQGDGAADQRHVELLRLFLARGVLGGRVEEETGDVEWIGWTPLQAQARRDLLVALHPVRQLDRLVVPELGVAVAELGHGILVSSEPPGPLRARALRSMQRAKAVGDPGAGDAPVVATLRHAPGVGAVEGEPGTSTIRLTSAEGCLLVRYQGQFEEGVLKKPCCQRRLDVELLDRMPDGTIAVFVEHADARILPGVKFLERLFPQLIEPEPPDERWARRLVVVGETQSVADGMRLPSIAIAIEADGPGASARRQDLAVLAALNSLRNRLGSKAGLQHLPGLGDLPESGTRTIYARALLDPALEGHPIAREISINWCVTEGPSKWHLYTTCPVLADEVAGFLSSSTRELSCVSAAHVGRIDARRAASHLRSWGPMAQQFVGFDRIEDFRTGIDLVARVLSEADSIDWAITVPDTRSLDASIRIWPRAGTGDAR